jgi:two-component system, OmpR family, response regulator
MANVLVVDDHADLREVVSELLKLHGHRVSACGCGETAMQHMLVEPPDCAIVDERLPGISGLQLLYKIRTDPLLSSVRVIICSADDSNRRPAASAGAVDFWLKGSNKLFSAAAELDSFLKSC